MLHLTTQEIDNLFDKAMAADSGCAGDGCGSLYTAQELFYEQQNRAAKQWFCAYRNGKLTEDQAEYPPCNWPSWEDFIN